MKVRMLESVSGVNHSYYIGQIVEIDDELAQKWNGTSCVILPDEQIETTEGRRAPETTARRIGKNR